MHLMKGLISHVDGGHTFWIEPIPSSFLFTYKYEDGTPWGKRGPFLKILT